MKSNTARTVTSDRSAVFSGQLTDRIQHHRGNGFEWMTTVRSAKELTVYRKAYALSMEIFRLTRNFPPEERFALTSQIRRSSRSVCLNLREAWAKRRHEAHFAMKLTDCDGENGETESSLDYAYDCGYITQSQHMRLIEMNHEVGKMLGTMLTAPNKWTPR